MNGALAMLGMLLAGGVLAGLIAADIRRHQNRERAAINRCSQPERQRDEHETVGREAGSHPRAAFRSRSCR